MANITVLRHAFNPRNVRHNPGGNTQHDRDKEAERHRLALRTPGAKMNLTPHKPVEVPHPALNSIVAFKVHVYAPPYSPWYDAYKGEVFKVIAVEDGGQHIELKCVSNPHVQVRGLVHPSDLKPAGKEIRTLVQEWGPRCSSPMPGDCAVCTAWYLFHRTGKCPSMDTVIRYTAKVKILKTKGF